MLTTTRSSPSSATPDTTVSQSWPVTVKTLASVVSLVCAYGSLVACVISGPPRKGERSERLRGVTSSAVGPPRVRRWNGGTLVLDGDAAERVVLALRVARPVVGHLDAGQRRVAVEDDPEEVVGLALVPVAGRVRRDDGRDVRVAVGAGDLEPDPAVVGHRQQVVHRMQLAALVVREVHPRDAGAPLEAQRRVV